MIEFDLDGRDYRFEKPSAMEQLHLTRKLAPLLPPLAPLITEVVKALEAKGSDWLALAALAQPFADALAGMKDTDAEYVFDKCLAVIRVKHQDHWITFWNSGAKASMLADSNDPSLMLRLVLRVLKESLANFMQGFLTSVKEPPQA
jgi:hypothetical protein